MLKTIYNSRIKISIFVVLLITLLLQGCSLIKMGSLFLSGSIKQENFRKEIKCDYQRGLIFIIVRINGSARPYRFIFDTGAAFNVISREIADDFGFKKAAASTVSDVHKKTSKTEFVRVKNIEIGGLHFRNTAAAVINLDSTPELRCYAGDGVIGVNLMHLVPFWQIDYLNEKIIVTDQATLITQSDYKYKIPFKKNIQRIPRIEAELETNIRMKFAVDLGSAGGFTGSFQEWEKFSRLKNEFCFVTCSGAVSSGAFGIQEGTSYLVKLKSFKVGTLFLDAILMNFIENIDPKVGNGFFDNFVFTLDWRNKQILLNPVPDFKIEVDFFSYGFNFSYHKTKKYLYVSRIYENSPASSAGIEIGDRIVKLSDKNVASLNFAEYCHLFLDFEKIFGSEGVLTLEIERDDKILNFSLEKKDLFLNCK